MGLLARDAAIMSTDCKLAIYGPDGRLDKRFLTSTKLSLTRIAAIAEKLSKSFTLVLDDPSESVSRLAATLHLRHHQVLCPLLFSAPVLTDPVVSSVSF